MKLSRDYSLVESRYKNIVLDAEKRRRVREVTMRKKEEEKKHQTTNMGSLEGGSMEGESESNDEMYRRQMQIQEDVSFSVSFKK